MSSLYITENSPEVIEILTFSSHPRLPAGNRKAHKKGHIYLCDVGAVVSPVGPEVPRAEFLEGPQPDQSIATKEDEQVAIARKVSSSHKQAKQTETFTRLVLRSVPFFLFILIATFTDVSTWGSREKAAISFLVVLLFASSVYAWWPRRRSK